MLVVVVVVVVVVLVVVLVSSSSCSSSSSSGSSSNSNSNIWLYWHDVKYLHIVKARHFTNITNLRNGNNKSTCNIF